QRLRPRGARPMKPARVLSPPCPLACAGVPTRVNPADVDPGRSILAAQARRTGFPSGRAFELFDDGAGPIGCAARLVFGTAPESTAPTRRTGVCTEEVNMSMRAPDSPDFYPTHRDQGPVRLPGRNRRQMAFDRMDLSHADLRGADL